MIRVFIVDDHTILRDGLRNILAFEEDIEVIGETNTGEEAIRKLSLLQPDVIIVDINLPDMNGIEITKQVKDIHPSGKILILTMYSHDEYFFTALQAGADGYLLKDAPSSMLIEAIRTVARGESVIHPSLTRKLVDFHQSPLKSDESKLSEREQEVLSYLLEGLSNMEIANKMFISDKTVKIHVSKILKKFNVKNRSQAVIYAIQNQIIVCPK